MRRAFALLVGVLMAAAAAGGCDTYEPEGIAPQYVVEAYLQAGATLPPVRLSRTTPVNQTYDYRALAVSGARVQVQRVDDDAMGADTVGIPYRESTEQDGLYFPVVQGDSFFERSLPSVEPRGRYRLEVLPPEGDGLGTAPITAETVVPDTFQITANSGDSLTWREDDFRITITRSRYPGRGARFVVSTTAQQATLQNLTPLAARLLAESDTSDISLDELSVTESPVINEGNYEPGPRGRLTIDIPWLVANFFGPNVVSLRAVDNNYYDFLRSQQVQQGGASFSPGEIPNVIERVAGGTGLFGSYAVARYQLEVTRPEDLPPLPDELPPLP